MSEPLELQTRTALLYPGLRFADSITGQQVAIKFIERGRQGELFYQYADFYLMELLCFGTILTFRQRSNNFVFSLRRMSLSGN